MTEPAPQVLSASSLATFMRCEVQWEYAYVEKLKRPPSIRQAIGLAAHSSIEHNMGQKILSRTDEPLDVALDIFADEYDVLTQDVEDPEEDPKKGRDSGLKTLAVHHKEVAPKIQPIMVEQPVLFEIEGIPYSGYIDLVDDKYRVRDNKFVGRKPSGIGVQYLTNMTGYAIGYRQLTGQTESEVMLDFHVRTKKPYHLPVASGGPIDDAAIRSFARIVRMVSNRIRAGVFIPTGLSHQACGWCGYREICPYYRQHGGQNASG